jgi:molecular chaperone Hsp33
VCRERNIHTSIYQIFLEGREPVQDYLVRAITTLGNVRGLACVTTHLVNNVCHKHETCPVASVALGRALTGGALMGALLKNTQRVALKFEGNGPLKKILVEANSFGEVRGYVGAPRVDLPLNNGKLDVAAAIGHAGFLTVTKDLGLKEPYKGMVQLYTSEIAEDLAYYFTESEQIPSAVGLGVFVSPDGNISAAGGFLIQSLPPANEAVIEQLVHQIEKMPPITELLRDGKTPENILDVIFAEIPFETLETQALTFRCSCSKERMERALISLGSEELSGLLKDGEAEVICEFCRTRYLFNQEELEQLIRQIQ